MSGAWHWTWLRRPRRACKEVGDMSLSMVAGTAERTCLRDGLGVHNYHRRPDAGATRHDVLSPRREAEALPAPSRPRGSSPSWGSKSTSSRPTTRNGSPGTRKLRYPPVCSFTEPAMSGRAGCCRPRSSTAVRGSTGRCARRGSSTAASCCRTSSSAGRPPRSRRRSRSFAGRASTSSSPPRRLPRST